MPDDVQRAAGTATMPGFVSRITSDPENRTVWLILMGAVGTLVVIGVAFRPR